MSYTTPRTCNYCDLPTSICQCPEVNQCDGCRRGLLMDHRHIHRDANGWPIMTCQAERYKSSPNAADGEGKSK